MSLPRRSAWPDHRLLKPASSFALSGLSAPPEVGNAGAAGVDLNMVPTSLIQSVDVVTGGASAAYGSDAVAGVVNIRLKDRIDGVQGSVQYGQTGQGDARDKTVSLAGGTTFADGRGRIIAGGDPPSEFFYSDDHYRSFRGFPAARAEAGR